MIGFFRLKVQCNNDAAELGQYQVSYFYENIFGQKRLVFLDQAGRMPTYQLSTYI